MQTENDVSESRAGVSNIQPIRPGDDLNNNIKYKNIYFIIIVIIKWSLCPGIRCNIVLGFINFYFILSLIILCFYCASAGTSNTHVHSKAAPNSNFEHVD